jgi:hypothetical protein
MTVLSHCTGRKFRLRILTLGITHSERLIKWLTFVSGVPASSTEPVLCGVSTAELPEVPPGVLVLLLSTALPALTRLSQRFRQCTAGRPFRHREMIFHLLPFDSRSFNNWRSSASVQGSRPEVNSQQWWKRQIRERLTYWRIELLPPSLGTLIIRSTRKHFSYTIPMSTVVSNSSEKQRILRGCPTS